eukprot:TRINITY_DN36795_c0_g1_i1.p2 TRINITY_DN36795_c0_g1~~TRINITY_DN36795_c0_g1_i1.p2  ORF type:complete len:390 (+),score=142.58 TRINITY_DN36795_c0_g1_i1:102-1271(+)
MPSSAHHDVVVEVTEPLSSPVHPSTPVKQPRGRGQGTTAAAVTLLAGFVLLSIIVTLTPERQIEGWDARWLDPAVPHVPSYYLKCMIGGVLACGMTHTLVGPLDVVKCSMQSDPGRFKSTWAGLKHVFATEGIGGLVKGMSHMCVGYGTQGMFKFSLYELFKDSFMNTAGREMSMDPLCRGSIFLLAASTAEVLADLPMCPFEMCKVKVMTAPAGSFPTHFMASLRQMWRDRDHTGFPFGSIGAIWCRQIPYTAAKFFTFEWAVSVVYMTLLTGPRDSYSQNMQLLVTFLAGYLSGVICTIVSHAPDSLLSLRAKPSNVHKPYMQIAREVGWYNLWTQGLGARILMVGTLTGVQWWIYDRFKTSVGLKTSGTIMGSAAAALLTPSPSSL